MPTYLSRGWRPLDDPGANPPAKPVGRAAVGWFSLLDCRVAVSDGLEDREDVGVGIGEPRDTRAADFGDTVRVGGLWPLPELRRLDASIAELAGSRRARENSPASGRSG